MNAFAAVSSKISGWSLQARPVGQPAAPRPGQICAHTRLDTTVSLLGQGDARKQVKTAELIRAQSWPASQLPRVILNPPFGSSGVHVPHNVGLFTHVPLAAQVCVELQPGPHVPPQPSEPHCFPVHCG